MIDVKLLQKDKYGIWPIEKNYKYSLHSALFKSYQIPEHCVIWTDNIGI